MKLHYKGSVRRLSGSGMAFHNFENDIEKLNEKVMIECPETRVMVYSMNDDGIDFGVFYFDKEDRYFVHKGETVFQKEEGNAFGFEINFSIAE